MKIQPIKKVQNKILEIMVFINKVCRDNGIDYYIMGGTALGAVRHRGFIPWDDDLDIFMTPNNYNKFKAVFQQMDSSKYVLQEWSIIDNYLGYAKIRMNGTTFIEEALKDRTDLHQGIYVDIMILHKCPNNKLKQKFIYYASKYVTLVGLSQRNWKPKNVLQKVVLTSLKILPNKVISSFCYKLIYKYDNLNSNYLYCYFLTKAKFNQGIFNKEIFEQPKNIPFENVVLLGPTKVEEYLEIRYGDYLKLPSKQEQQAAIHAQIYDTDVSYEEYLKKGTS